MIVNHMICSSTARLKCRSQVTGQVRGYRPQVRLQVTGHRSQIRSQVTQKTIGHYTKNKISQGTLMIFLSFKQLNSTRGIIFSCWSYGISKLRNEITKVCKIILYEKQITCFSLKTKCCRVIRMSSQNKLCSQDNLERVIEMQHCNHKHGSIHSSIQC